MKNKILVELIIPEIEETYNIYIPVNKRVGNIIILLTKAVFELNSGLYKVNENSSFYNRNTGTKYNTNDLIRETDIRNGTSLVLI